MSMNPAPVYIGIDIAKATLAVGGPSLFLEVPNTPVGFARVLAAARRLTAPAHFICEATGGYERQLVEHLQANGQAVTVAHPGRVRQFAKATGQLAKTDRIDAQMLAAFGQTLQPAATAQPDPLRIELSDIGRRRSQLAECLGLQRTQRQQLQDEKLIAPLDQLIVFLEHQIADLETRRDALVAHHAALTAQVTCLRSVEGVGQTTAVNLLAELPELGSLDRSRIAALAGLAPFNCDSGGAIGVRHIRGGRAQVRRALYMAALTATRCNPVLRPFYLQLRARGKGHRVAITAVMRKLLIHLNHLMRQQLLLAPQHS